MPGLGDVEDHQVQAIAPLDEVRVRIPGIVSSPHDLLVGIVEVVVVSADLQHDHAGPCFGKNAGTKSWSDFAGAFIPDMFLCTASSVG